ncbi:MAG: hypothetical protein K8I27_12690 [Planctomycetes bacterium]|nr:hypothetical protein [Planctomycetota bacterium]
MKGGLKVLLTTVAAGLVALVLALVVLGVATDWAGLGPYPPSPRAGVLTTSQLIVQDIDGGLYEGLSLENAHARIDWETALTPWHSIEDVSVAVTSSDGEKVDGGTITFRPTEEAAGYVYHVETSEIVEQE